MTKGVFLLDHTGLLEQSAMWVGESQWQDRAWIYKNNPMRLMAKRMIYCGFRDDR